MGKRLKQQRRGNGTPTYKAPTTRYKIDLQYRSYDDEEKTGVIRGQILDFVDDPGRNAILMKMLYDNGEEGYLLANEGAIVGNYIELGAQAKLGAGNVLPLYRIPDGAYVFNLERYPGDRGKLIRAPGSYGIIVSRESDIVYVKLPSKQIVPFSADCRTQIGIASGGGVSDKPLMKAGTAFYKYKKARNRMWPRNRGVKMSAYNHPHGGKQHHEGKSSTIGRGAPPGSKVGHIAAKSTGRKKVIKIVEER
ncbi:MAG: 50S ribosomal protein L2 [Candidatus Micrarchaeota archaeon]